jgi:hypothetical protein
VIGTNEKKKRKRGENRMELKEERRLTEALDP